MWYYGGMDVPFVDPTLKSQYGVGSWNYGLQQPIYGNKEIKYTVIDVNGTGLLEKVALTDIDNDGLVEVLPIGSTLPYGTPQLGFSPFVNRTINPFFRTEINPFVGLNTFTPQVWGTPYGVDRFGLMNRIDTWGVNRPWFTTGTFGYSPVEELWKSTLGITPPIYGQTLPFFGQTTPFFGQTTPFLGQWGLTPFHGIGGYTPFGFTGVEDRIKFNSPFGFYNTPMDWKVKSFGTPVGIPTDTWSKGVGFPWKTNVISGPVAVL
jgi:hypothetical protein